MDLIIQCSIHFFFLEVIMVGILKYYKICHRKRLLLGSIILTNYILDLLQHYYFMVADFFNNMLLIIMLKLNLHVLIIDVIIKIKFVENFIKVYKILFNQELP